MKKFLIIVCIFSLGVNVFLFLRHPDTVVGPGPVRRLYAAAWTHAAGAGLAPGGPQEAAGPEPQTASPASNHRRSAARTRSVPGRRTAG